MSYPQHKERFYSYTQLIHSLFTILRESGRKHGVVWCSSLVLLGLSELVRSDYNHKAYRIHAGILRLYSKKSRIDTEVLS